LSFLLIRVSALWKRREALTTVMSFLFLALYFWAVMKFNMASNEDEMANVMMQFILRQKQTLDVIAGMYPPVQWLCGALLGSGLPALGQWLLFAAVNAAVLGLCGLLLGGSYQRLAIKQNEAFAKMNAKAKRRRGAEGMRTPFRALYQRETREIFTVPVYATNCLAGAVVMPLMVILMSVGQWEGTKTMATGLNALAGLLSPSLYRAIATALMAFGSSMCMAVGTAVSREGKRHDFYKTLPVPARTLLAAKLSMGLTLNAVCMLPVAVLLGVFLPALIPQTAVAFAVGLVFALANDCFALWLDARRPKLGWKTETEAIKQNTNGVISMFVSMGLVAALCGGYYGLSRLGLSGDVCYLVLCAALAIVAALLYRLLMTQGAKAYLLQETDN
ncbi:MAG: hypothetical protein PHY12_07135, partial [Eubacteriales bacterium]|nr:hypothetical protein [Eubacteriales bacterium]